jgi:hypothetical protein
VNYEKGLGVTNGRFDGGGHTLSIGVYLVTGCPRHADVDQCVTIRVQLRHKKSPAF